MNKKPPKLIFVRLFFIPIGITLSHIFFDDSIHSFQDYIIIFCVAFTLNWFFDKTIVQNAINRGQKLTKEKENKLKNE